MFCTKLRGQTSLAGVVPQLQQLGLKEHRLETHDFFVPIRSPKATTGSKASRTIRFLVLGPSDIQESSLSSTLPRIRHFAALTGGRDLIICFTLQCTSSSDTLPRATTSNANVYAYAKLQNLLARESDLPPLPILLCSAIDDLAASVKSHIDGMCESCEDPITPPYLSLLAACSNNEPMDAVQADIVSNYFASFAELSRACATVAALSRSNGALDLTVEEDMSVLVMQALRSKVGSHIAKNIFDFWTA